MACKAVLICSICLSVLCLTQHLIELLVLLVNMELVNSNSLLASFQLLKACEIGTGPKKTMHVRCPSQQAQHGRSVHLPKRGLQHCLKLSMRMQNSASRKHSLIQCGIVDPPSSVKHTYFWQSVHLTCRRHSKRSHSITSRSFTQQRHTRSGQVYERLHRFVKHPPTKKGIAAGGRHVCNSTMA